MDATTTSHAAVIALALEAFSDMELAAFNNAIQTFGSVNEHNAAYDVALQQQLIKANGYTTFDLDATQAASAHVVNERFVK